MMRRKLLLLPLVAVSLTLSHAAAAQSAEPAAASDGKFHLIYLVSAVDLKPGSKVYVDPIFFTDGKEVKNFHDHCKPDKRTLKPEQIVGDLKLIEDYCAKKTFTFDPKGYHTLNNHGQQVTLSPVEFKVVDHIVQTKEPVMMGQSTVASYTPGTVSPPKWLRNDGAAEYFFAMSRDNATLQKIVPASKATQVEVDSLAKRAEQFSKLTRGRMSGTPRNLRDIDKAKECQASSTVVQLQLENPLLADLDLDGKLDMLVSAHNVLRLDAEPDRPLMDCFTRYRILGNGDAFLLGNEQWVRTPSASLKHPGGTYERYLKNGYAPQAPLIVISLPGHDHACAYAVSYVAESIMQHPAGIVLGSDSCRSYIEHDKFRSVLLDAPEQGEAR